MPEVVASGVHERFRLGDFAQVAGTVGSVVPGVAW
jgi:hypothetical protein